MWNWIDIHILQRMLTEKLQKSERRIALYSDYAAIYMSKNISPVILQKSISYLSNLNGLLVK